MEIFELKYFLAAAHHENIHKAALELRISPGSVSKAVARLEQELGIPLFLRQGRNIVLSHQGKILQRRASEIVFLEDSTKSEISDGQSVVTISIAGPEALLIHVGLKLIQKVKARLPHAIFELIVCHEEESLYKVQQGECMLALTTLNIPKGMKGKNVGKVSFETCVGPGHALYPKAKHETEIHIILTPENRFVELVVDLASKMRIAS